MLGANYCDNTRLLIVIGHMAHGVWFVYCMTGVMLALNRYIELKSPVVAERLYSGKRVWLWFLGPITYGIVGSSSLDLPPIYNSMWSVYLFQIDFREDAAPVNDWFCFSNSCWVVASLVIIYTLLMVELRSRSSKASIDAKNAISKKQKKVLLQSFLICFFLFLVASSYAVAGFIRIPLPLTKFATIAIQLCSGRIQDFPTALVECNLGNLGVV